jgi:type 1 fimbriae regulatory protein FimB/type 1 fimbriae regulatory protein FimE
MCAATSAQVVNIRPDTESRTVHSRTANDEARGRKHLMPEEVRQLVKAARKGRQGPRDALMIQMAFEHGLRASELVSMKWQAVNFVGQELAITRAKGSKSGTHQIQGGTLRALKRYHRHQGEPRQGFMFSSERGAPVSVDGFRRMLGRLSARVLGVQWNPHALRHACGYHLINSGADLRVVQQYLGHANIQNTVAYTALTGRQFERLTF